MAPKKFFTYEFHISQRRASYDKIIGDTCRHPLMTVAGLIFHLAISFFLISWQILGQFCPLVLYIQNSDSTYTFRTQVLNIYSELFLVDYICGGLYTPRGSSVEPFTALFKPHQTNLNIHKSKIFSTTSFSKANQAFVQMPMVKSNSIELSIILVWQALTLNP